MVLSLVGKICDAAAAVHSNKTHYDESTNRRTFATDQSKLHSENKLFEGVKQVNINEHFYDPAIKLAQATQNFSLLPV